jgi:hypothetical protein
MVSPIVAHSRRQETLVANRSGPAEFLTAECYLPQRNGVGENCVSRPTFLHDHSTLLKVPQGVAGCGGSQDE